MRSVPFGRSFPLIKKDILTASLPLLLWILQDFTETVLEKVESIFSFIKIKRSYKFYNQHKIIKERKTIMIENKSKILVLNKLQNPDNVSVFIKKKMAVSLMLHLESICESSKRTSRYSLTVLKLSLKKSGNLILI